MRNSHKWLVCKLRVFWYCSFSIVYWSWVYQFTTIIIGGIQIKRCLARKVTTQWTWLRRSNIWLEHRSKADWGRFRQTSSKTDWMARQWNSRMAQLIMVDDHKHWVSGPHQGIIEQLVVKWGPCKIILISMRNWWSILMTWIRAHLYHNDGILAITAVRLETVLYSLMTTKAFEDEVSAQDLAGWTTWASHHLCLFQMMCQIAIIDKPSGNYRCSPRKLKATSTIISGQGIESIALSPYLGCKRILKKMAQLRKHQPQVPCIWSLTSPMTY